MGLTVKTQVLVLIFWDLGIYLMTLSVIVTREDKVLKDCFTLCRRQKKGE